MVLEGVCSRSLEWNFPVCFANLGLKKAFDRTESSSLFGVLHSQGVSRPYVNLLAALSGNQTGDVNGKIFPIQRGVKQGDVISPLSFNAGLEHAIRKWKLCVFSFPPPHRFFRGRSGWNCFIGQFPGMCRLCTGGSGCAGRQGQVQATVPLQRCGFGLRQNQIFTNVIYADELMLYAKHCHEW